MSDPTPTVTSMGLTDEQQAILAFEQQWWKYHGAKETAILDTFGCSATTYYAKLNALIDTEAALAHDPMTVRRLRRMRAARRARRSAERLREDGVRR